MDFFIDNMVKKSIQDIVTHKDTILDNKLIWYSYTKLMFKNFPAIEVWEAIEKSSEEAADEFWFEHKYTKEDFKKMFVEQKKYERKEVSAETKGIVVNISIIELADKYDLKPLGKSKRVCPFHADSEPSLSLSEEKGLFKCFGCNASGNIIKFKAMLNKIKGDYDGSKQRGI
jgi:hypothetical protein